jgi:hypothetical protein
LRRKGRNDEKRNEHTVNKERKSMEKRRKKEGKER